MHHASSSSIAGGASILKIYMHPAASCWTHGAAVSDICDQVGGWGPSVCDWGPSVCGWGPSVCILTGGG
jgi:hypothetical protein